MMSVLLQANLRSNGNLMKTANMTVERVTRSAVATPSIRLNGTTVNDIKTGSQHLIQLSSFSGLIAGDILKVIVQSSGEISDGAQAFELPEITFVNGIECAWSLLLPETWKGLAIVSVQHVNYGNTTIGYKYYSLK